MWFHSIPSDSAEATPAQLSIKADAYKAPRVTSWFFAFFAQVHSDGVVLTPRAPQLALKTGLQSTIHIQRWGCGILELQTTTQQTSRTCCPTNQQISRGCCPTNQQHLQTCCPPNQQFLRTCCPTNQQKSRTCCPTNQQKSELFATLSNKSRGRVALIGSLKIECAIVHLFTLP